MTLSTWLKRALPAAAIAASLPGALLAKDCVPKPPSAFAPPTVAELSTSAERDTLVVTGRVVGSDCRPLAGALVELWSTENKKAASATTGADGRFRVTAVASRGPVHIRITHSRRTLTTQRAPAHYTG